MYHINYHSNIADLKAHYALLSGLHFETVKAAREFSEREAYKVMHTLHQECPGVLFDRSDTDRSVTIRLGKATCRCTYAQAIQDIRYPDSTGNQWVPNERPHPCYIFSEYISNHAFYAWAHISEESSIKRGQSKCTAWYASYHVSVHLEKRSGLHSGHMIKSVDRKRFSNKDEALQYIAGRKEALAKLYFSSLDPVIPAECRSLFLFHGVELPGYRYEPANDEAHA